MQSGDRYNRWTIISSIKGTRPGSFFLCQCECGSAPKAVSAFSLKNDLSKSCGCLQKESATRDLRGIVVGRLTVLHKTGRKSKSGNSYYLCVCECGNTKEVRDNHLLTSGETRSCGCVGRALSGARLRTHGKTLSVEFTSWAQMKNRCNNSNHEYYRHYGGRGINVCDAWNDSFEAFLVDMGNRPSPVHSIDRIDGNEGYHPLNCRWATKSEQTRNIRGRQGQHHTISPGVFTTTRAIFKYLVETIEADVMVSLFATYRREHSGSNFYQYCKKYVPSFDERAFTDYAVQHHGIFTLMNLKEYQYV